MAAILLEGKPIAEKTKAALRHELESLVVKCGRQPRLAAIQIGQNRSSEVYVKAQKKTAESLGILYDLAVYPEDSAQAELDSAIAKLNTESSVDAIILQLPVPKAVDAGHLARLIAPEKDAEGMHPANLGQIVLGKNKIGPCTAMAVMELLQSTGQKIYGKEALVVGHSAIVGKPLALMLLNAFATTTVCHIATGERGVLAEHVKRAEILVVAVGKAGVVKGEWIKPGAIVIDVGINKVTDTIVGDVEFDEAAKRASFITPVPGGVGPLTTAILMRNTVELYKSHV